MPSDSHGDHSTAQSTTPEPTSGIHPKAPCGVVVYTYRPQNYDLAARLRPMHVPYSYTEPLGSGSGALLRWRIFCLN